MAGYRIDLAGDASADRPAGSRDRGPKHRIIEIENRQCELASSIDDNMVELWR